MENTIFLAQVKHTVTLHERQFFTGSIEAELINMGRISMISHLVSVPTSGGNAGGANCVFPFIYQGQQYWECIVRPAVSDYPWCATTGNYDENGLWGNCPRKLSTRWVVATLRWNIFFTQNAQELAGLQQTMSLFLLELWGTHASNDHVIEPVVDCPESESFTGS